jgi:hypothetical protein
MNQDQVKELLLSVKDCETDFTLIFSGKKSTQVNGLYKPLTREIVIHNRNFENDNQLIYTSLHEYAHHLHAEAHRFEGISRAHSSEFWSIFHELLELAEASGRYRNVFDESEEFADLTERIKANCVEQNGKVMLEFGRLMIEAEALCRKHFARFEDYVDRVLQIPRVTASAAIRAFRVEVPPALGWDNMKFVSAIRDPGERSRAIEAFESGKSPDSVRSLSSRRANASEDPIVALAREKQRVERTIESLKARLARIEDELERAKEGGQ